MNYLAFSYVWLLMVNSYCFDAFKIGKSIMFTKTIQNCNPKYLIDCFAEVNDAGTPDSSLDIKQTVIREFPDDTNIEILLFKHESNSKTQMGRKISHNFCNYIKNDKLFYPGLLKYSNFIKQCPIELKTYVVNKYKVSLSELPPMIWDGNLSVIFNISTKTEEIHCFTLFVNVS